MGSHTNDPADDLLRDTVRRVAHRLLAEGSAADDASPRSAGVHVTLGADRPGDAAAESAARPQANDLVTAEDLAGVADDGELRVSESTRLTPLAREEAERRGIRIVTGTAGAPSSVAIGADHGGVTLKDELARRLGELGHRVHDLGTHGTQSVDYPDYAAAVAREVAAGRATIGVVVDGAGIGSSMVANKHAGVRAANCTSVALAKNAREHNHANVLTLGAGHLTADEAAAILAAFLATPFGPGRHARRVAKIDALDASPTAR